jgi:hypothetical protein
MVPASVRFPTPFEYAFPHGALALGVAPDRDFDRRGQEDDQARDKLTGARVWVVTLMDLDPDAQRFGRDRLKVRIASEVAPMLPASAVPGYPPRVELTGLTLTPYVDSKGCTGSGKCRARVTFSLRAEGVQAASSVALSDAA